MTDEIIEGEVMAETSTALAPREDTTPAPVGLFGTDDPAAIVKKAQAVAEVLVDIIKKQKLSTKIGGKDYVLVEGWTTLGQLVGVTTQTESTQKVLDADGEHIGWEAAVIVTNAAGRVIGRAEAECLRSEKNWKSRDDFALRSMAQTRAMGKALRMPLGWIAVMGGYEATPAEEMPQRDPRLPLADDVPFEQGDGSNEPAAVAYASEEDVTGFLEIAAKVSNEDHVRAVDWLAAERRQNDGHVPAARLAEASSRLLAKAPA